MKKKTKKKVNKCNHSLISISDAEAVYSLILKGVFRPYEFYVWLTKIVPEK